MVEIETDLKTNNVDFEMGLLNKSTMAIEWLLLIALSSQIHVVYMQDIKYGGRDTKCWAELNEQTGQ